MMNKSGRTLGKAGFTLIEILVALILISLLVAAVFPVMTQQTSKADVPRLSGDLTSIRSAVELFNADVRNRLPGDLEDLVRRPNGDDLRLDGVAYSTPEQGRWDGPYLDVVIPAADEAGAADVAFVSGFDASVLTDVRLFNSTATNGGDGTTATTSNADWAAIKINGLSAAAFAQLNTVIDGLSDTNTANGLHTGRLRSVGHLTDFQTAEVYYLVTPYRNP